MFYYLMLVNDLVYYSLIPDDFLYSMEWVIKCPLLPQTWRIQILLVVWYWWSACHPMNTMQFRCNLSKCNALCSMIVSCLEICVEKENQILCKLRMAGAQRNLRRKPGPETRRHQTRAARRRLVVGSPGGRRRTSSTSLSISSGGRGAMLLARI